MALGSPEQAAEAQLTWTREELVRTRHALGRFQRYYEEWLDFHSELSSMLGLDTTRPATISLPLRSTRRRLQRSDPGGSESGDAKSSGRVR
jgi:hypothetical protein